MLKFTKYKKTHISVNLFITSTILNLLLISAGCFSIKAPLVNPSTTNTTFSTQIISKLVTQQPTDINLRATQSPTPLIQDDIQTNQPTEFPTKKNDTNQGEFNGDRAYRDIEYQVELGPRTPGSLPHAKTIDYIEQQLIEAGWEVQLQTLPFEGKIVKNIIANRDTNQKYQETEWIILGTHYDTRLYADRDPDEVRKTKPVPGANDGASGVSILLELARVLPVNADKNVWLVFFDAEDNGKIQGWDWALGSQAFVDTLKSKPDAVVIVDMVGDEDLDIYIEKNSDDNLVKSIWDTAASLGFDQNFIPVPKHSILDDHTPFLDKQIPAALVIDIDYQYWHTTNDTIDKVSANSLQIVGDVIHTWLTSNDEP